MRIKLTGEEMREVYMISANCTQSVESLCARLEKLAGGDGLLEFRMQADVGLLPWMKQLQQLSDRINLRLQTSDIPINPSLEKYEEVFEISDDQ
ncbi:MAG: hypothetical protein WBA43_08825 [Elainellaceae cyanobacterium]